MVCQDHRERYLVIDGYKRIAALQQLGRDTVEATVWAMSEAEALVLSRSLRFSPQESALEQGWLLAEMEQRFGYSVDELARRFDRSASWVSRRLALVEWLPEAIQQQVREGKIAAQVALKYLVPVARVDAEQCRRMAAVFVEHHCDTRQAGQLYAAWRQGTRVARERILAEPELFFATTWIARGWRWKRCVGSNRWRARCLWAPCCRKCARPPFCRRDETISLTASPRVALSLSNGRQQAIAHGKRPRGSGGAFRPTAGGRASGKPARSRRLIDQ